MRKIAWMFAPKGKRLSAYVLSRYTGVGGMLAAAAIPAAYRYLKRRSAERRAMTAGYGGLSGPELAAPTAR
jgi:hypothetical protein